MTAFERKPQENAVDTSRMLADLEKTATILQSHLGNAIGLRLLGKAETFQFFSYLFNLEEWRNKTNFAAMPGVGPADREDAGCVAQRSPSSRQTSCADVLAEDHTGGFKALPLLRSADARLR